VGEEGPAVRSCWTGRHGPTVVSERNVTTGREEDPLGHESRRRAWYFTRVATVVHGEFEWDEAKAAVNESKHGVSFLEALTVFEDVDFLLNTDARDPSRFIAVGLSDMPRVLVVVHAARADRTRLISARRATLSEEQLYADRRR
jgi:uncharacterized DUF497 family protein